MRVDNKYKNLGRYIVKELEGEMKFPFSQSLIKARLTSTDLIVVIQKQACVAAFF